MNTQARAVNSGPEPAVIGLARPQVRAPRTERPSITAMRTAIMAGLPQRRFGHVLELGCGDLALGPMVARRAARYTVIDPSITRCTAALAANPAARIVHARPHGIPASDPEAPYDLVLVYDGLLSQDRKELERLGAAIDARAPRAELLCAIARGRRGALGAAEVAFATLMQAMPLRVGRCLSVTPDLRLDLMGPNIEHALAGGVHDRA